MGGGSVNQRLYRCASKYAERRREWRGGGGMRGATATTMRDSYTSEARARAWPLRLNEQRRRQMLRWNGSADGNAGVCPVQMLGDQLS